MCRTHKSTMPTQGQGHRSRSWIWALNFVSAPYLLYPWKVTFLNFGHMFASMRRCAELITQPWRYKIKVTVQGHGFVSWFSCPLCISYTSGRIFFKFWSNVHYKTMCRINNSTMPTQGQGHSSWSWVWALNSCPLCISLNPGRIFSKLWSNVHLWYDVQNP